VGAMSERDEVLREAAYEAVCAMRMAANDMWDAERNHPNRIRTIADTLLAALTAAPLPAQAEMIDCGVILVEGPTLSGMADASMAIRRAAQAQGDGRYAVLAQIAALPVDSEEGRHELRELRNQTIEEEYSE